MGSARPRGEHRQGFRLKNYTQFALSAQIRGLSFDFEEDKAPRIGRLNDDTLYPLLAKSFDCPLSLHSGSIESAVDAGVFDPAWLADSTNLQPSKITCVGHTLDGSQLSVDLEIEFPPMSLRSDIASIDDLNEHCDGWVTDLLDSLAMNDSGYEAFGSYDEIGVDEKLLLIEKGQ